MFVSYKDNLLRHFNVFQIRALSFSPRFLLNARGFGLGELFLLRIHPHMEIRCPKFVHHSDSESCHT